MEAMQATEYKHLNDPTTGQWLENDLARLA